MRLLLDVWSDYVCPFCYLEEPILAKLQAEFADRLAVRWRAFELRPEPEPTLPPRGDYLLEIWERAVYPMARDRGMQLALPPVQPRSRLALEAAEFARAQGKFEALHRAIFRAFFEQGRDIGEMATLLELGRECGLERAALKRALTSGEGRAAVLADEELAGTLGISGVPALLFRREGEPIAAARELSGAQPEALVRAAIRNWLAPESAG